MAELHFWRTNLDSFKVRDCFLSKKPQSFVYSDASATGCGSVITLNEDHICHRLWEPSESLKSSTWSRSWLPLISRLNLLRQSCGVRFLSDTQIVRRLQKSLKWEA